MKLFVSVVVLVVLAVFFSRATGQNCAPFDGYNFENVNNGSTDLEITDENGKYYVQVCKQTIYNCSNPKTGYDGNPAIACQVDSLGNQHSLGLLSTGSYAQINTTIGGSTTPTEVIVCTYTKGQTSNGGNSRQTTVTMICDPNAANPTISIKELKAGTILTYAFNVTSAKACPGQGGPGNSVGGTVFVILVFVLLAVYFIAGAIYMKFVRKAEGFREIIPNYEFWVDLPSLLKDGVMFLFNKTFGLCRRDGYTAVP